MHVHAYVHVHVRTTASGDCEVRKSISPFIIQELLVSPGCTLAVTTTAFLP